MDGKNAKESEAVEMDPQNSDSNSGQTSQKPTSEIEKESKTHSLDSLDWNDLTVEIRNLKFTYQKKVGYLLNDINMTFPKSAIYGLLGSSGCGKTTLLKLILNRLKPSSGTIKVNGRKPGDQLNKMPGIGVGFMPQELSLYAELSIRETLQFFANIYGLKKEFKTERINFLIKFLDLPDPQRNVGVLSGGQQRRVSLAVAIIHNPPFLILDEPTVGVDPLLRERIWEHLVILSKNESTSILITTHYIEEARRAHVISLMRGGRLLVEHSPHFLLKHFFVDNLELVFLKVCEFETKETNYSMPKSFAESRKTTNKDNKHIVSKTTKVDKNELKPNFLDTFLSLTHKNFKKLLRNKLLLAVEVVLPTLCIVLFCVCIGSPPFDLPIAVFNGECVRQTLDECSKNSKYSPIFLNAIDKDKDKKTLILRPYDSEQSAKDSVHDSLTYGALVFGKNFTKSVIERHNADNFQVSNDTIDKSSVHFYGDFSDVMIHGTIAKTLLEASFYFGSVSALLSFRLKNQSLSNSTDPSNPLAAQSIIHFVDPPIYGSLEPSFRNFMTPGIILCVTYILAVALTSLSFVVEKKEGLLDRTLISGVKIYEILFSQITVQFVVLIVQTILLLIVIFAIFQIENNGNYGLIIILILMQGLCGMCFGLLVSSISRDEPSAIMFTVGSFFPYLILSGVMWPLEGMHLYLRYLSYIFPQTLPIMALRNIMLKGWTITKMFVWLGYVTTIIWTAIFIIFTIILISIF